MDLKKQTISFTLEGHAKVKEMAKRYGVNQFMIMDVMIESVDEQSPEFAERVEYWQDLKGAKKTIKPELAAGINEITKGMSDEEIIELMSRAKAIKDSQ